ncbi:Multifunctional tryptophan biosynthesis protein [Mycena indigotica]|uniref:Multifunctional tryptophan biosynthesis protein n=1 Tax=Mycena indigotica TaxID=2126181 RepID=A0A8H6TAH7_9AGAR|nr:Multifunctional tryptophan biosynthesis protein [Mycena indigotica]KAF7315185.1 Multifunctional tryptophan biosynthesis protein [Mycena indigotica]
MADNALPPNLATQLDVLMIDNFDSFTWNLYQQLCLLGASVTVIRNDAIPPSLIPKLKIKSLIISPGPGHPQTDSGISKAAIDYFQGKVPVLGVCMGLECLVDLLGGQISYAGEIMHGKISRIRHDNRGCFKDVPQNIKSTRYHSLSASTTTLPPELAVTALSEDSGVIMGVRHRKYTVEAVQYHPESVLSEGGDELIRNFLSLRGGKWEENPSFGVLDSALPTFPIEALPNGIAVSPAAAAKIPSILEKIYAQRLSDVAAAQKTPGSTLKDLETLFSLNIAPPLIPFLPRLRDNATGRPSLMAEIKRASPSKGPISLSTSPPAQALTYALAGAHTISVLTEPKWFLGTLHDMLHARLSVANLPNRPAILRKDFILSKYQILESRIWGADTILLIVSMLPEHLLRELYAYSLELGMEPLVEVNNAKEMELALSLPAKVIGVNNRNLHNFDVDMGTTSRLSEMVRDKDVVLCALSGISTAQDVDKYAAEGVGAVLIGESLMRATDTTAFIRELLTLPETAVSTSQWRGSAPLVKICGIRTKDEALAVAEAGADMLGLMFVEKSKRHIDLETARDISEVIRALRFSSTATEPLEESSNTPWFTGHATRLSNTYGRPLLVGVFQNASLSTILHAVSHAQLDIVQLHGSEPTEWARHIPVPVIRAFHVGKDGKGLDGITRGGAHEFILLDSLKEDGSGVSGGTGKVFDWDLAKSIVETGEIVVDGGASYKRATVEQSPPEPTKADEPIPPQANDITTAHSKYPLPIILAGGLTASNVAVAIAQVQPWAVDVSGGVETEDGTAKDIAAVKAFIGNVRGGVA